MIRHPLSIYMYVIYEMNKKTLVKIYNKPEYIELIEIEKHKKYE